MGPCTNGTCDRMCHISKTVCRHYICVYMCEYLPRQTLPAHIYIYIYIYMQTPRIGARVYTPDVD